MAGQPEPRAAGETYADLEVRILERQPAGYPVELTLNREREFGPGLLAPDLLPWVPSLSPAADGERLFRSLLADPRLLAAWAEIRGLYPCRRIRLRIDQKAPELQAVPWELLREPATDGPPLHLAASNATPFSRYLAGRWQPGSPILRRPIRMLAALASPAGLDRFGLAPIEGDAAWAALQAAVAGLPVELVSLPQPCSLAALEAALRQGSYHVLHLMAHGRFIAEEGRAILYLADAANQVAVVGEDELAALLARQLADTAARSDDKLRLVFLACCESGQQCPTDASRGLAPALVAAGVPAVVAMQEPVAVDTASAFGQAFYVELLRSGQVDVAANAGRAAVIAAGLPGAATPAVYMRLRDGQLLGWQGRVTSGRGKGFWPFLLQNIDDGLCTPFLGPRVTAQVLPPAETIAERLAGEYGFPLANCQSLARVAQFMAVSDPDRLRTAYLEMLKNGLLACLGLRPARPERRALLAKSISQLAEELGWAEHVLEAQENEIHHLLAALPFPLYVTTNVDSFMVEALKHRGRPVRRIGLRWEPEVGAPLVPLWPPPGVEQPVVLHLNGHDGEPDQAGHLVLSEDDYLAHFVRLARDQDLVLPVNVPAMLAQHSFLFLGYSLDDWEFRVVLQGLLRPRDQPDARRPLAGPRRLHVAVQLEDSQSDRADEALQYIERYLGQYQIEIYWGTPQQFVAELHARWQEYVETGDDG